MICSHPTLRDESKFVFVPGPADPGSPNIYPRPPLPDFITKELKVIHYSRRANYKLKKYILTI